VSKERAQFRGRLLLACGLLVLGLLVAFAIELSNAQASSKSSIEARVHDRAVLAAALVDSLFATVTQQVPASDRKFGRRIVSSRMLDASRGSASYLALLGPGGVVASSSGFTAQARQDLRQSGALALVRRGHQFGLGNLVSYGRSGAIDLAVPLSTPYGRRVLIEGFPPGLLGTFLGEELARIPGVAGAHNLIVDAHDTVIATNTPALPVGHRIVAPAARSALRRSSGERNGRYFDQEPLSDSTWRIVLSAPSGALFASVTGFNQWVPWLIFAAFATMAAIALALGWRLLHSAERDLARVNLELECVNRELAASNRALARRADELARSNAELDQFASIASHDLQEPLRKVRTFTEQVVASESDQLSDRGADYLSRANRAAERMQGLIQDLLQFSRVTTHPRPFVRVDLNWVMTEVLDDLALEIEGSGAVVSVGDLPGIAADPLQMRQLFLNLVSNALKFRRDGVTPEISIRGDFIDGTARIVVSDNGIGFEPRYSTRIFRVFERLNGRGDYPGTGIGLALCQKIAARHGGAIEAEGELHAGATFTVTLPVEHAADAAADGADPRSETEARANVAR
jgi:signal transduction histidine kinase